MKNTLYRRHIISINDLSRAEIELVIKTAQQLKMQHRPNALQDKIIASCFFEASTRTRLSFEAAAYRLGANVIGFSDAKNTSLQAKGESLHDTIKVIAAYADAIVMRHPAEGAARLAASVAGIPVINAGDGSNQHPTQTLLDLFTIKECQGKLDKLNIALVGDLKYGRTVHSLAQACSLFDSRLFFISPENLMMPDYVCNTLKKQGIKFSFHRQLDDVMNKADIIYMTRLQKERFDEETYRHLKAHYVLNSATLKNAKKNLKILHPLPRIDEIAVEVDSTAHAYYFQQATNGLFVRQALLDLLLNK